MIPTMWSVIIADINWV